MKQSGEATQCRSVVRVGVGLLTARCERASAAMWRQNLLARKRGAVTRRGMPAADAVTHSVTLGGIARWYLLSRPVVELDSLIG